MLYSSKIAEIAKTDPGKFLCRVIHPSVFTLLDLSNPLPEPEKEETAEILKLIFRGTRGQITISNDGLRVLIEAFLGERPVLRSAIRDRKIDGTDATSPLTMYPNTDPACNRLPGPDFECAELSIYSWSPRTYLTGLDVRGTVGHFIADPDSYMWKDFDPRMFFKLWEQAFFLGRAPWQTATPMRSVAQFFVSESTALLMELGYHRVDAVPSWFNVARFFDKMGFEFTYGEHRSAYDAIVSGLKCFSMLDPGQQAWLVTLQNVPETFLPRELKLPARWPVTHTNIYWVRMHKDLNPYRAPEAQYTELTDLVCRMRKCSQLPSFKVEADKLHTAEKCPQTSTLGESSPGATSPSATDSKPVETPREMKEDGDRSSDLDPIESN
jgi:hypothetical protein